MVRYVDSRFMRFGSSISWISSCGLVVYRRFERTYFLRLEVSCISQLSGKKEKLIMPSDQKMEVVFSSEMSIKLP
jgi:hypothetical protein